MMNPWAIGMRACLAMGVVALPALAQAQTTIRVGDHPGFGRVVFDFGVPTEFDVVEAGDRLLIVFAGAPALPAADGLPRNVRAIESGAGSATLVRAPGTRFRSLAMGNRVVVDVFDSTRGNVRAPGRANATRPDASVPIQPRPVLPSAASPSDASPVFAEPASPPTAEASLRAPIAPVSQGPLPPSVSEASEPAFTVVPAPVPVARPGFVLLAMEAGIGAAAFRRGSDALVVFDQQTPIDPAMIVQALPTSGPPTVQVGPASTTVVIPLAPDESLTLRREVRGWELRATNGSVPVAAPAEPASVEVTAISAGLLLKLDRPGIVVAVADPSTGQTLLVGTANPTAGAGAATATARRAPGYALAATWLGVVVEPMSDATELRPASNGFLLVSPALSPAADAPVAVATAFTRRFDFANLPVAALLQRLRAQVAAGSAAPARSRSPDRIAAAHSMLSLGLATEAQAVLCLAATDDPAAAAGPELVGLKAIAALLAGRSHEAGGIDDPRLDGSDDIALWRGVRDAMRDTDPAAGQGLPRLLPLVDAYPAALRDRLRPLLIEAAVLTGQTSLAAAALGVADDHSLDLARALSRERDGNTAGALAAFDLLASGRDQLAQVRAGVRAAELRLRTGTLTAGQAADVLERQAAIWRGDGRESAMRLRAAELRSTAGSFRPALELLRETERLFPEQQPSIRTAMAAVFQAMLTRPQVVPPLDLVTIASDFATLLPGADTSITGLLADKLLALDLPDRAGPVLAGLMTAAPAGPARAVIGARLAQMQIENGAAGAAQATLAASGDPDLPASVAEQRTLLGARALAAQGDVLGAAASLLALGTAAADDLRATLLSQAADWPGSLAALSDLAAKTIKDGGLLDDAMQDLVLRQATAAVQANDMATLALLQRRHSQRLAGSRADLFRLLTAEPLRSPADLPRTGTELALARLLPNQLGVLSARNSK